MPCAVATLALLSCLIHKGDAATTTSRRGDDVYENATSLFPSSSVWTSSRQSAEWDPVSHAPVDRRQVTRSSRILCPTVPNDKSPHRIRVNFTLVKRAEVNEILRSFERSLLRSIGDPDCGTTQRVDFVYGPVFTYTLRTSACDRLDLLKDLMLNGTSVNSEFRTYFEPAFRVNSVEFFEFRNCDDDFNDVFYIFYCEIAGVLLAAVLLTAAGVNKCVKKRKVEEIA